MSYIFRRGPTQNFSYDKIMEFNFRSPKHVCMIIASYVKVFNRCRQLSVIYLNLPHFTLLLDGHRFSLVRTGMTTQSTSSEFIAPGNNDLFAQHTILSRQ